MNKIIMDMKSENIIHEMEDLKSSILFLIQNQKDSFKRIIDLPEVNDLPEYFIGNENKLEYDLGNDSDNSLINEIYNTVKVYTSDCCGLGKSYLIKKEIEERGEDYNYFGIGDDISKEELFKKLKRFLKIEIKGKFDVGIHLDLFYTQNITLMNNFVFSILIID